MGLYPSRAFDPKVDLQDLFGKVAVVTGAHIGVGFWTATHLSRRGARVYVCAPTAAKAHTAIQRMKSYSPAASLLGSLIPLALDMTNPRAVRDVMMKQKVDRLDLVVINEHIDERGKGEDMVVDHLSPFVIVDVLSPTLERTAKEAQSDVRVIVVTSSKHEAIADANFGSPGAFSGMGGYAMSKLANILYTKELQRRYNVQGVPITCTAVYPGVVYPESVLDNLLKLPFSWIFIATAQLFAYLPEQGAYTSLYAAASSDVTQNPYKFRGGYMVAGGRIANPSFLARDGEIAEELWENTERTLKYVYGVE